MSGVFHVNCAEESLVGAMNGLTRGPKEVSRAVRFPDPYDRVDFDMRAPLWTVPGDALQFVRLGLRSSLAFEERIPHPVSIDDPRRIRRKTGWECRRINGMDPEKGDKRMATRRRDRHEVAPHVGAERELATFDRYGLWR